MDRTCLFLIANFIGLSNICSPNLQLVCKAWKETVNALLADITVIMQLFPQDYQSHLGLLVLKNTKKLDIKLDIAFFQYWMYAITVSSQKLDLIFDIQRGIYTPTNKKLEVFIMLFLNAKQDIMKRFEYFYSNIYLPNQNLVRDSYLAINREPKITPQSLLHIIYNNYEYYTTEFIIRLFKLGFIRFDIDDLQCLLEKHEHFDNEKILKALVELLGENHEYCIKFNYWIQFPIIQNNK